MQKTWVCVGVLLWGMGVVCAEEKPLEGVKEQQVYAEPSKEGWDFKLHAASTFSYTHNKQVVGSLDGATMQVGVMLDGFAGWLHQGHQWNNDVKIQHTQTRTPQFDKFIKSADVFTWTTFYAYHTKKVPWIGPFVQSRMSTQLLPGADVRAKDTSVVRVLKNGETREAVAVPAGQDIALTKPFEPLVLSQSVGAFVKPWNYKWFQLSSKTGVGAQELVSQNGYVIADDPNTNTLELKQIQKSIQAGAVAEVDIQGMLTETTSWKCFAHLFYPFYTNAQNPVEGSNDLNTDIGAKVAVKLASWASLEYMFVARKIPLVLNEWQIQNGLVLALGYDYKKSP